MLRGDAPGGGRGDGEVLRRLQRGDVVEAGIQRRGGFAFVALVGSHDGREAAERYRFGSSDTTRATMGRLRDKKR